MVKTLVSDKLKIKYYVDLIHYSYARCISFSPSDQFLAVSTTEKEC